MRYSRYSISGALILVVFSGGAEAKNKARKPAPSEPQDQIVVNSRIPVTRRPITHFVLTQHYNRSYVYAECSEGPPMLIDITRPDSPKVLSESGAGNSVPGNLVAVAGTAVLASDHPLRQGAPQSQTIRIFDYSNPAQPKITRQFDGVTAIENAGALILLANADGIWILSKRLAEDPEEEAEYARRVVYGP